MGHTWFISMDSPQMFAGKSRVLSCSGVGELQTGGGAQDKLTESIKSEIRF